MAGCYECTFCGKCTMPSLSVSLPRKKCLQCGYVFSEEEGLRDSCPQCGGKNLGYLSPSEMAVLRGALASKAE